MASRITHFSTLKRAPWWALLALVAFLGQLTVMGASHPGEMPRATIERLTGHVITSAPVMTPDCPMDMPDMATPCGDRDSDKHPTPGHDADSACFLCPLLTLAPAVLAALPFVPLPALLTVRHEKWCVAARAPPSLFHLPAFPRGPPALFA